MLTKLIQSRLLEILRSVFQIFRLQKIRAFSPLFAVGLGFSLAISAYAPSVNGSGSHSATIPIAQTSQTSHQTSQTVAANNVVRIGYQKAATILNALKNKGELEKALASSGFSVTWNEFPSGPSLLEAINSGSVDFGYTGESPPIFAQVAGTPLVYVAYDPWSPKAEAILVPKNSPIKTVADLKGKKVAFAKGSNTNYLVVKALEKAGVQYSDIKSTSLQPADARAAFEGGKVDAWAIWDPYLALAEKATGARILIDGTGLVSNRGYYLAAKSFVQAHPDTLKKLLEQVKKTSDWAKKNSAEVAKFLSSELKIDAGALEVAEKRRDYGVLPITNEVIAGQQKIADTFYKIKLVPKQVNIKESVWKSS